VARWCSTCSRNGQDDTASEPRKKGCRDELLPGFGVYPRFFSQSPHDCRIFAENRAPDCEEGSIRAMISLLRVYKASP
jgi:hypothetical protein